VSNAKVRARRRGRANRAWTKAMTPVELSLAPVAGWVPPELKKRAAVLLREWHETGFTPGPILMPAEALASGEAFMQACKKVDAA
jgi:hypothetical protein